MKREKMIKTNKNISVVISNVVSAILFLIGLALVLYPTAANTVNKSLNGEAIEKYKQSVREFDSSEYQKTLDEAVEYNEDLALRTPYICELTQKNRERYKELLNFSGNGIIGYIDVPRADIYLAIYHGTEESVLRSGVGHLEGSSFPVPGESVHTVLTGHSGLPSARMFSDLDQLEIGDNFYIHVLSETLTYQVESITRIAPEEIDDLQIKKGEELCTLLTCTPYGINTQRLMITGRRIETKDEEPKEDMTLGQTLSSGWNIKFVLLPPLVLIGIAAAVILIRRKIKRRKQAASSDS